FLLHCGIFLPLIWYVFTMTLLAAGKPIISVPWNLFIFRFFIACTVVSISFLYRTTEAQEPLLFPFLIHNLFLLGARNTLLVFRYVGVWWIGFSLFFLY